MKFTLFETQGTLSDQAVMDVSSAVNTFYNSQLADYYNKEGDYYFKAIHLTPSEQNSITEGEIIIEEEPIRNLRQITRGTQILFNGTIEFTGDSPSSSEIVDAITFLCNEHNDDLVSNIIDTGNSELSNVFIVLVEDDLLLASQTPSSTPSTWPENFARNPDGIAAPVKGEKNDGTDTSLIIIIIAGVATLTMLILVFATRRRYNRESIDVNVNNSINMQGSHEMLPEDEAIRAAMPSKNSYISDDLIDNAERSIVSSVTDWNDYAENATHNATKTESILVQEYEVELKTDGSEEVLQSAAEINCKGTMTLEKEDNSVVPKSWLDALHGDNSSIISSKLEEEASSIDDSSTENDTDGHHGGFPSRNEGAFPTRNGSSRAECNDWSHIGTVTEDELTDSKPSAHEIVHTLSQETDAGSKSSLNQFISDLVWLEKKIADESEKEAIEANKKEGSQGSGIQIADSYSYECDNFSPRTYSDEESTLTSNANSQAMSIVCRDCYIPPGNLDIEIASTKDGPVIRSIKDKSLGGHLNVGDLIMALDDNDTRSLSAEELATTLSSRAGFQRKLTLLHFGGTTRA